MALTKGKWKSKGNDIYVGKFGKGTRIANTVNPDDSERICRCVNSHVALLEACKMVNNSIFQDKDGEWQLSRPKELLKTICEEAISQAKKP